MTNTSGDPWMALPGPIPFSPPTLRNNQAHEYLE